MKNELSRKNKTCYSSETIVNPLPSLPAPVPIPISTDSLNRRRNIPEIAFKVE